MIVSRPLSTVPRILALAAILSLSWLQMLTGTAADASATSPAKWTLSQAVDYALNHSPTTRAAQYRIAAAEAGLQQANAAFMPQVSFHSSYLHTDNPMMVLGSALNQHAFDFSMMSDSSDADNLNVHGMLTVPIYNGGRSLAGRKAAKAQTEASRHVARGVRNQLAFEVARTFYTIHKTREFIRATQAAVAAYATNLTIVQNRHEAGTALKTEVLDVEVQLARAKEDLVRAENAHTLSLRILRNLLGIESGNIDVAPAGPPSAPSQATEPSARPEVLAALQMAAAAESNVRVAKGGYLPRVDAFGRYDYDRGWELNGWGDSYAAGVSLNWQLFDGDLTRAKVSEARANHEVTRENVRRVQLAVDLEVQQARINLKEAIERLVVTDKAVDQASESAELTRARFEQGLALSTQLIDAETALTAARVRRAEAQSDQYIAIAALRKALGLSQFDSETNR